MNKCGMQCCLCTRSQVLVDDECVNQHSATIPPVRYPVGTDSESPASRCDPKDMECAM